MEIVQKKEIADKQIHDSPTSIIIVDSKLISPHICKFVFVIKKHLSKEDIK